jgi:hypothetical protein
MINQVRKTMPGLAVRNHIILMNDLKSKKIGRDKLFDILRANHLLIQPKRNTNSHHRFRKHQNLILDLEINRLIKFVSDITYIGKRKPCYLSIVTDAILRRLWDIMLLTT